MVSHDCIVDLGHAWLLLQIQGTRIPTDVLLLNRVFHHYRRSLPVASEHYADINVMLISHNHRDHLDLPSLRRLDRETRIIAPHGVGAMLRRRGYSNIEELREGENTQVGPVRVRAEHANHMPYQPLDSVATTSSGYLIDGHQKIHLFADTDCYRGMAEIAQDVDFALLPVAGWGPTLGDRHMGPQQAAEASNLLAPGCVRAKGFCFSQKRDYYL